MSFLITVWTIVTGSMTLLSGILYLRERYKYVSDRPRWLRFKKPDIGNDITLLVKKLAQIGEWMENSEEPRPLLDEIRLDVGDVEWRVWIETYSYFALYSKDEELKEMALRNLSQVKGKKAIQRALRHLRGIRDGFEAMPPSNEIIQLTDAVIEELEELFQLEPEASVTTVAEAACSETKEA